MNTSEFLIETSDLELAQKIGETISDKSLRNKAVASVFAVNIASKYFDTEKYDIDTESGLHNIPNIHSDIDISDIYVNSNYIDVRIFFEGDTPSIPCSLINNNILPVAFLFIKVDSEFSNAEVIGFIRPEDIDQKNIYNDQILIEEASLTSFYDIEPFLINNEEFIEIEDVVLDEYLTGKINDVKFFENLTKSKDARLRLAKLAKAQYIFNFVSLSKDTISNNTNIEQNGLTTVELDTINNKDGNFNLDLDSEISINFNSDISIDDTSNLELSSEDSVNLDFDSDISIDNSSELELNSNDSIDIESDINIDDNAELELNSENSIDFDSDISIDNTSELELNSNDSINIESNINIDDNDELELNSENSIDFDSGIDIDNSSKLELNSNDSIDIESDINLDDISEVELSSENSTNFNSDNIIIENNKQDVKIDESMDLKILDDNINESNDNTIKQINNDHIETNFDNNFKTVTTPNLLDELEKEDTLNDVQNNYVFDSKETNTNNESTKEDIDSLFNTDEIMENDEQYQENPNIVSSSNNKKTSKIIPIIGLITLLGGLGYLIYSKIVSPADISDNNTVANNIIEQQTPQKRELDEAMPVESVETTQTNLNDKNEGIGTTVPAIEQNLDASILVSNLKVDWEVPTGYASNTSAKRYLIKLGKILQLNLKTELLLLNKPPITNKIGVEIKFNENTKKFEPVGVTISSGEESVDNIILNTVRNTLNMNLSTNTNSISKLQGNPVLIIHL